LSGPIPRESARRELAAMELAPRHDATMPMSRREFPLAHLALVVRDLCQLRRGPEDLPYSKALFGFLIAASVALDLVTGIWLEGMTDALPRSLVSTGLVLGLCWIALAMRHFGNRYVQTASALVACSIVFSLLILPFVWLAGPTPVPPAQLTPLQVLFGWATIGIIVWNLVVNAHIVRRALDAPFALGLALAIAWTLADWALAHALFDATG
jgi:hypothetical protein